MFLELANPESFYECCVPKKKAVRPDPNGTERYYTKIQQVKNSKTPLRTWQHSFFKLYTMFNKKFMGKFYLNRRLI